MSADHKAALAKGREEGRIVRQYLEALESTKPRRGRKRTPDSIRKRLAAIDAALPEAEPLNRLHLVEEKQRLEAELAHSGDVVGPGRAWRRASSRSPVSTASARASPTRPGARWA